MELWVKIMDPFIYKKKYIKNKNNKKNSLNQKNIMLLKLKILMFWDDFAKINLMLKQYKRVIYKLN